MGSVGGHVRESVAAFRIVSRNSGLRLIAIGREIAARLKPSDRHELEITDINRHYLREGRLRVEKLGRGIAWLDTGTQDALLQASNFIQAIEERQGLQVACIEEIAYRKGFIDKTQLEKMAQPLLKSGYGQYLINLI